MNASVELWRKFRIRCNRKKYLFGNDMPPRPSAIRLTGFFVVGTGGAENPTAACGGKEQPPQISQMKKQIKGDRTCRYLVK